MLANSTDISAKMISDLSEISQESSTLYDLGLVSMYIQQGAQSHKKKQGVHSSTVDWKHGVKSVV
jgi:hypothetical protein